MAFSFMAIRQLFHVVGMIGDWIYFIFSSKPCTFILNVWNGSSSFEFCDMKPHPELQLTTAENIQGSHKDQINTT